MNRTTSCVVEIYKVSARFLFLVGKSPKNGLGLLLHRGDAYEGRIDISDS